ncbi:hypothetical protein AUEXF2481DRAFT_39077 [Aureobasidium subglaciale EXF-2481]|uniref:Uncharacterized protein n=1 Tax=Aureobasidium subglaciale (strain EXF-2481) TaxID=1043005 RepID=A0A074YE18_AURSE|nr:uncharacterized protein AUEXF2481DRAFT_39077 [Aureobasidium subglaciale EXF-2481]KAI5211049.1 hypothetical protein E4T38_01610 [Aureobasidium subglaciale]KAI5219075.1 hypothetical protein E4T40_06539 [Aureobasidium subglaciale]KAI5233260.1 hypothetical protein E4T41_01608 [Aureobasidium subglaciale]KAI5248184.1 hypothetical protein E4T43_01501 [Aureobasidium subglaciale]KAI5260057.1 hypothetical protein E4T46_06339 [Aureobasidium subglaciale]
MTYAFPGAAVWLREQWSNPRDIFTILLIIGGDIVRVAVAQLSAGPVSYLTPVAFSFGWVSYAVSAMLSAVGEARLMPRPEIDCIVINAKTGYSRNNNSWILSRMLRDFEFWYPRLLRPAERQRISQSRRDCNDLEVRIALRVSVWRCDEVSGRGEGDFVYWTGFLVAAIQISISAIPWAIYKEWFTFFVTTAGTMLALASGALPQWSEEKINVPRWAKKKDIFLTTGNGAQDAILFLGCDNSLDLEALAGPYRDIRSPWFTRICSMILATLWIALLISVAGWQQHTWYLLSVGIIGLVHNIFVAGKQRQPEAFGIKLKYEQMIAEPKVMGTLWKLEEVHPRAGKALIDVFFPGDLSEREKHLWAFAERRYRATKNFREREELKLSSQIEQGRIMTISSTVQDGIGGRNILEAHAWGKMPSWQSPKHGDENYFGDIPNCGPYTGPEPTHHHV